MNKCAVNLIALCGLVILTSCASTPQLQQPQVLNTKSVSSQYYYCESCPKPTKLTKDTYVALEPDEPVIKSNPIIVAPAKKETKKHKKRHRKTNLKTKPQPQCVLWK